MTRSDIEYFRQRATVERQMAAAAADAASAAVHEELARGYEALVRRDAMRDASQNTRPDQDQRAVSA